MTWEFELGADRTFADGSAVTSADVVASLTHAASLDPTSMAGSDLDAIEGVEAYRSGGSSRVSGLGTQGDDAVEIVASEPNYELPALLANTALAIRPARAFEADADSDVATTDGSGPFRLADAGAGGITFERIEPSGALDRVEMVRVENLEQGVELLRNGDVDLARHPSGGDAVAGASVISVPVGVAYLVFNIVDGTTASVEARSAATAAIDRESFAQAVVGRPVSPVDSLVPGGWWAPDGCHAACSYSPDVAILGVASLWPQGAPTLYLDADLSDLSSTLVDALTPQFEAAGLGVEPRRGEASAVSISGRGRQPRGGGLRFLRVGPVTRSDPVVSIRERRSGQSRGSTLDRCRRGPSGGSNDAECDCSPPGVPRCREVRDVRRVGGPLVAIGALFEVSDDVLAVDPILGLPFDPDAVAIRGR